MAERENGTNPETKDPRAGSSRAKKGILAGILVLAVLALLFGTRGCSEEEPAGAGEGARAVTVPGTEPAPADSAPAADSLAADSLAREGGPEAAADTSARAESGAKPGLRKEESAAASARSGARKSAEPGPSSAAAKEERAADSAAKSGDEAPEAAPADTVPPELILAPPSGRFYGTVEATASCEEAGCSVLTAVGDSSKLEPVARRTLSVPGGSVWAVAVDSAGNRSGIQRRDFVVLPGTPQCGANAVPAGRAPDEFCIDQYEWPNRLGVRPTGSVSHQAAQDSCASVGKTLCTFEQWKTACRGPEGNSYPYGGRYRQRNCYTSERALGPSGRKANCRSWYGVYDMSGNLWEWTSTPDSHPGRYLAAGGSWGVGDQATCSQTKWSFFPQNEYPIVGFRCCAPLGAGGGK